MTVGEVLAVVAVVTGEDRKTAICSGVVVAPQWVLTARHCVEAAPPADVVRVAFGDEIGGCNTGVSSVRTFVYAELDAALLEIEPALALVEPLGVLGDAMDESWVGAPVELAGFGLTETGSAGRRLFVGEQIVAVDAQHVVVRGGGSTGACVGDSGGPLLGRGSDGFVRVVGVLDKGSGDCRGEDYYTRIDLLRNEQHWACR